MVGQTGFTESTEGRHRVHRGSLSGADGAAPSTGQRLESGALLASRVAAKCPSYGATAGTPSSLAMAEFFP